MYPKLRLKYRPNLISLAGGMQLLPVTQPEARATPTPVSGGECYSAFEERLADGAGLNCAVLGRARLGNARAQGDSRLLLLCCL